MRISTPLTALAVLVSMLSGLLAGAVERPHIVLMVADDLGRTDVGFMGAKETRTPHLDALAKGGAILDAHYVQSVCSPTRAALLTGRYATRTGVYTVVRPGAKWGLPLAERTLAQVLQEAGYETAICGKWHLGEFEPAYRPTQRGFDHQYGQWFGAIDYFTHQRDGQVDWHRNDQPLAEVGYSTELIAAEACRLIRSRNAEKPFFLYLPFNAVHGPYQVPEKYTEPFNKLEGTRRTYAGMLAAMDEAVGRVVAALREAKMLDNTLIVFTSDNGGPSPGKVTDNGPLRAGKGTIYEGGVRVCAFAHWAGHIKAGTRIAEPMHAVDWFPTFAGVAGAPLPKGVELDGRDLRPVLTENAKSPHDHLLLVGPSPAQAAVRVGDWKLVVHGGESDGDNASLRKKKARLDLPKVELFNLAHDVAEARDLSSQEPARRDELKAVLAQLLKDAVPSGVPDRN